jgi:transcriptional regulator with XRE-family HTH domain
MLSIQCKMARVALGLGVRELAVKAAKSPTTIAKFERGDDLLPDTVADIRKALEDGGAIFIDEDAAAGVGVRLAKRKPRARRK